MTGQYLNILLKNKGALRIIQLNNIKKKNALSQEGYKEVTKAINDAATDNTVNVLALTGTDDYYSSGNDIISAMNSDPASRRQILTDFIHSFIKFPKLLVAVINGPAIGIAATTAALCDVVYASNKAYFYTPFVELGLCSEACSSYMFPKILGKSKSNEMLLLNHKMYADEALRFNFVSELFDDNELDTKIWPKIEKVSQLSIESMKACKRLSQGPEIQKLIDVCEMELDELAEREISEEALSGMLNFMNRKSKSKL